MKTAILIALLLAPAAYAFNPEGTNLTAAYPAETCKKPFKPSAFKSKSQQEDFDNDVALYLECVKQYVANATNDITSIRKQVDKAAAKANAPF